MTPPQNSRRSKVFEAVDCFDLVFGNHTELTEGDVDIAEDFAVLVCFSEDHEDIQVVMIGTRHAKNCLRIPDEHRFIGEGVCEFHELVIIVTLEGRSIRLIRDIARYVFCYTALQALVVRESERFILRLRDRPVREGDIVDRRLGISKVSKILGPSSPYQPDFTEALRSELRRLLAVILDAFRVEIQELLHVDRGVFLVQIPPFMV